LKNLAHNQCLGKEGGEWASISQVSTRGR
jgi:hypothetical protein